MTEVVRETRLEGLEVRRGKVRDVYDLGDRLLIVATDRISAYDVVMPNGIPDKGRLLTGLSLWWFDFLAGITPNHLITADVDRMGPQVKAHAAALRGRTMLCRKARVFPVECVVRGYLAGSGWREYSKAGTVCGTRLPPGLKQCDQLPEPIFTPATKAESGHDENISFEQSKGILGEEAATALRDRSLAVYRKAAEYARQRGVIIADTKFEWGEADGEIILVDEVLTPDSSRFWPADSYAPGHDQPSFDKQFVRNYLDTLDWDKTPPGPELPQDIVTKTRAKYVEAYERITGTKFA
ncbi:MAG: phosphoribosylaminoimidazolesuccinocarboxamide synthase [Acidobacteria bacterium]|nr:phosphoribosylaminoimidazolesuccinocarboxamide synthase [Planctomycetota bacterium]MBE3132060.1 phosphoribosylaminoimidazolesuccinocarboxamide synthase [Acidobacteriota bacterium]